MGEDGLIADDLTEETLTEDDVDFAVAAYREEGRWIVATLPARVATTSDRFIASLRQLPGEGGVFGFACIAEEFFVIVRTTPGGVRGVISDGMAILDWSLAEELADAIGLDWDEDDLEEFVPEGDLAVCADFGLAADELQMTCEDEDLLPAEQVRAIAKRMGFGAEMASVLRSR